MASPQSDNSTTTLPTLHDVLIIGAGPSGLAVAARLRETTPSALYTDEEHRRYHWLRKHSGRSSMKNRRTGRVKLATSRPPQSLILLHNNKTTNETSSSSTQKVRIG